MLLLGNTLTHVRAVTDIHLRSPSVQVQLFAVLSTEQLSSGGSSFSALLKGASVGFHVRGKRLIHFEVA